MDEREMICTACPVGCYITVKADKSEESGYRVLNSTCDRGVAHGIKEVTNPTRLITSTVRVKGKDSIVLPVRTDKEIPKGKIFDIMKIINQTSVELPIKMGDLIVENILETNVNIIASKTMG